MTADIPQDNYCSVLQDLSGRAFYNSRSDADVYWSYEMRRDMQEIVPGIFLGPYSAAMKTKKEKLLENNITHIVCVRHSVEANFIRPNFVDIFKYLVLDIADSVTENIIQHFPRVKRFLDNCLAFNGKALVHGNGGISRSAALVIGYVMERYEMSYSDALHQVQEKRFCIYPNEGFLRQLVEYEPIYRARLTTIGDALSSGLKRPRDEVEEYVDYRESSYPSVLQVFTSEDDSAMEDKQNE